MKHTLTLLATALLLAPLATLSAADWKLEGKAAWQARDSQAEWVFKDRLWIGGGWFQSFEEPPRDVWASSDGKEWKLIEKSAPWLHSDLPMNITFADKMWIMGGWHKGRLPGHSASNQVWSSADGVKWEQATASAGWSPRLAAGLVEFRGRMWLLGGTENYYFGDDKSLRNDVWSTADGKEWKLETANAGWSPRAYHQAAVLNDRIYVFGGGNYVPAYHAKNDVWSSGDGVNWTRETEAAPWSPRLWFSAAVYRDRMWVLGGWSNNPSKNWGDVWHSKDGRTWERLETKTRWKERHEHSVFVFQDKLWIAGGHAQPLSNEVWSLSLPEDWKPSVAAEERGAPWYDDRRNLLLFPDKDGGTHPVKNAADWSRRVAHIRANMELAMGKLPAPSPLPHDLKVDGETRLEKYTRRHVTFVTEANDRLPGWLLVPHGASASDKHPAMICLPGSSAPGKDRPAGLTEKADMAYGHELAERGCVCLVLDYPLLHTTEYKADPYALNYGSATMKGIVNHRRGVDVLGALPEVDSEATRAGGANPAQGFQLPAGYPVLRVREHGEDYGRPYSICKVWDDSSGGYNFDKQHILLNFSSCCGQAVLRSPLMPEFHGYMTTCEPVGRFIRLTRFQRTNGIAVAHNAYPQSEFIRSTDAYFRPVWTENGPDGCLYIADMYRGIIQEKEWFPTEVSAEIKARYVEAYRKDKLVDWVERYQRVKKWGMTKVVRHGRIYRLVPDGKKPGPQPRMLDETPAQLTAHLAHRSIKAPVPEAITAQASAQPLIAALLDKDKATAALAQLSATAKQGQQIYQNLCTACHGPDGQGVKQGDKLLAPAIAKSPWFKNNGDISTLARILLHGQTGPIEGITYGEGVMLPLAEVYNPKSGDGMENAEAQRRRERRGMGKSLLLHRLTQQVNIFGAAMAP